MTTNELFEALHALQDGEAQGLIKDLQAHQLELEIQNRELQATQQQLAHSRVRYADLYDFAPIGYACLTEDGVIEEINIAGGKLLGDNPHKLIGRSFADFVRADEVQYFGEHLKRCRNSRRKWSIEVRLMPRQAPSIDIQLFTMATQDADRHTLQFRTAMIDVTMRKRAEAAVLETQKKLEQIVADRTAELISARKQQEEAQRFLYETSSILAISLDYEITLWTVARAGIPNLADACVVDMVQDDDSIKRVAFAHVRPEMEDQLKDLDAAPLAANAIRTGQPELQEHTISVPLLVRGKAIGAIRLLLERDDRTYNPFDLALAEDLADRAAIALDNATLYTKELEANRLKDEFLSIVSHELRTPLTPILGAIYKLRASRDGDRALQSSLDIIERNAKAQARIVEELLDVSRITTGKLDFHREPTDLRTLIEGAIEVVRPSTEALGIPLHVSLDPPARLVWCDRDRIQQVIWSLLSNAIKFTGPSGSIEVRLECLSDRVHIRISDTGAGISPQFLPHIFERFRQADSFATRLHGGLGVGLSIVRHIVERHGGNVRAESRGESHGATFTVDLPYA
jgi:PAS domain S-box-containing protein